jgi:hypothetical protein
MGGIFLDHLTRQGGPRTRLEKSVVAQARRHVLDLIDSGQFQVGQEVVVKGKRGVVQADGSITPNLIDVVQTGFATRRGSVDITQARKRSAAAYKPGDRRSAEGMAKARKRLDEVKNPNSRI